MGRISTLEPPNQRSAAPPAAMVLNQRHLSPFFVVGLPSFSFFFFFNDTRPTEISPLPLHDALPIFDRRDDGRDRHVEGGRPGDEAQPGEGARLREAGRRAKLVGAPLVSAPSCARRRAIDEMKRDRKSTRLNSSHQIISYAVLCFAKP